MIEAKHVPRHRKMTIDEMMAFCFKSLPKQFLNGIWWLVGLVLVALLNIAAVFFAVYLFDSNSTIPLLAFLDSGSLPDLDMPFISGFILTLLLLAVDFIYALFATAYIYRLGLDAGYGTQRSFGERLSLAYKEGWALAGVGGLYVLMVILMMTVSLVVTFGATFTDLYWLLGIQILFELVSTVALYYFSVKLSCWIPLIIEEGYTTFEAWSMSFAMTKGRGWRIFGYQILIGLIVGIGAMLMLLILGGAGVGLILADLNGFISALGGILVTLAYFAFIAVVTLVDVNLSVGIYNALDREHTEDLPQEAVIQREEVTQAPDEQVEQGPKDPLE